MTLYGSSPWPVLGIVANQLFDIGEGAVRILVIVLVLIASSSQAWAKIQLCNKFKHPINVALAYDQNGAWVSDGWITINPGQCQIDAKHADLTSFYYYGETGVFDGSRWTWGKTVDRR